MGVEWYDEAGLAALRAEVIKVAYRDYVYVRMSLVAFERTLNPSENQKAERRRVLRLAKAKKWDRRFQAVAGRKDRIKQGLDTILYGYKVIAAECEAFFLSEKFRLFSDNIDGEALLDYANKQVERWKRGEIDASQVLPNNAEDGSAAAQEKKDKWRKR